jgi:hypothetical protein
VTTVVRTIHIAQKARRKRVVLGPEAPKAELPGRVPRVARLMALKISSCRSSSRRYSALPRRDFMSTEPARSVKTNTIWRESDRGWAWWLGPVMGGGTSIDR